MRVLFCSALALIATPVSAEVVSASPSGFEVRHVANLLAKPDAAYSAFANVGSWWDSEHTYSGDSRNLSLDLRPGGCFCERIPKGGGGIEHLRVAFVEPGKRIVLTGALGPLLYEAVTGVMDVQIKSTAAGSQLTLTYRAAGFASGKGAEMAPLVDGVLAEQVKRLRTYAASRPRS